MNIWDGILSALRLVTPEIFVFLFFIIAAWGYGRTLLAACGIDPRDRLELSLFAIGLGYGILSHLILFAGLLGLLLQAVGWILLAVGAALSILFWARAGWPSLKSVSSVRLRLSLLSLLGFILLGLNLAFPLIVNTLTPPVTNDEIAYHLPIAQIYLRTGYIGFIPFIPYSNWPLETEMLYLLSLVVSSDLMAHMLSWGATLLTCLTLFHFGRRHGGAGLGWLAAAFYASLPVVQTLSGQGMVEPALAMFSAMSVYALITWIEDQRRRYWLLSALFAGLAASAKLNAALIPAIFGVALLVDQALKKSFSLPPAARLFAKYGVSAFLVVLPWYLKSWIQTGNPFWSFFPQWIQSRGWDELGTQYLIGFIQAANLSLTPANWLRAAWKILTNAGQYGGWRVSPGWGFLAVPIIWAAALIFSKKRGLLVPVVFLALTLYTAWFFTTQQSRFLMPILPLWVISATLAAAQLANRWPMTASRILYPGLALLIALSSWFTNPQGIQELKNRAKYVLGGETRTAFLQRNLRGFTAMEYVNRQLPASANLLMGLFEVRSYYLERSYYWLNPMAQRSIQVETYANGDALAEDLLALGFTHLLNSTYIQLGFENYPYGLQIQAVYQQFIAEHCKLLYEAQGVEVYEILH